MPEALPAPLDGRRSARLPKSEKAAASTPPAAPVRLVAVSTKARRSAERWIQLQDAVRSVETTQPSSSCSQANGCTRSASRKVKPDIPRKPNETEVRARSAFKQLQQQTELSAHDLKGLLRRFALAIAGEDSKAAVEALLARDGGLGLSRAQFAALAATYRITNDDAVVHLFSVFDPHDTKVVEFARVAAFVRAATATVCDGDGDGSAERELAEQLFRVYNCKPQRNLISPELTLKEVWFMLSASPAAPDAEALTKMVHGVWQVLDTDGNGRLDRHEWARGLAAQPLLLEFFNRWFVDAELHRAGMERRGPVRPVSAAGGGGVAEAVREADADPRWSLDTPTIGASRLGEDGPAPGSLTAEPTGQALRSPVEAEAAAPPAAPPRDRDGAPSAGAAQRHDRHVVPTKTTTLIPTARLATRRPG